MATASLVAVTGELRRRMGPIPSAGVNNCRAKRINGVLRPDKGYSEHAFGNAEDLAIRGVIAQTPYVNELARMKEDGFPVGLVLWAGVRSDHTDHIHVEGYPPLSGGGAIPPCAGGPDGGGPTTIDEGAPRVNIPLVGDLGPVIYRTLWFVVAIVATVIAIRLLTKGYTNNPAVSATRSAGRAIVKATNPLKHKQGTSLITGKKLKSA